MMKPITKKVLFGMPAVVLTAALACAMVGCGEGPTDGTQGESGGEAPAEQKTYESQKVEVMGSRSNPSLMAPIIAAMFTSRMVSICA